MFIELWQLGMVVLVAISAFFSYRKGNEDGIIFGVQTTILDLHNKGIVMVYKDNKEKGIIVGRYDEKDWKDTESEVEFEEDDY
jgi:hypothetical protein